VGNGLSVARLLRRDGREEAEECWSATPATPTSHAFSAPSTSPFATGSASSCSPTSPNRDGKFQLKSLAESSFDPLARTCSFMLTEEAHHMFVGDTGINRVVRRTLEVMKELARKIPRPP